MAEKLTMKKLSGELDTLRARVQKMEREFELKLERALEKASDKIRARLDRSESVERPLTGASVDAETRYRMIERAAYLRAEQRGFAGGNPEQDWLEAEAEVDRLLLDVIPEKQIEPGSGRGRRKGRQTARRGA